MTTNQLMWLDQDGLRVGGTQLWTSGGGVGIGTSSIAGALTVGSVVGTSGSSSSVALTVYGSGVYNGSQNFNNITETTALVSSGVSGVINYFVGNQSVLYYTANAGSNWTVNLTFSPTTTLNSAMTIGQSMTVVLMTTQGSTAYYTTGLTIDGNTVTANWQGGTAPSAGNASSIDVYTYSIIKTASATFTILASLTRFA
jgi:hypothetical protein